MMCTVEAAGDVMRGCMVGRRRRMEYGGSETGRRRMFRIGGGGIVLSEGDGTVFFLEIDTQDVQGSGTTKG